MADPRIERSCQKLADALIELLIEQPNSTPAVEQVLQRAKTARATFYRYFTDLNALLAWQVERLLDAIAADIDWQQHEQDGLFSGRVVRAVVQHVQAQPALFRLLLTGQAGPVPLERLYSRFYQASLHFHQQRFARLGSQPDVPLEIICSSISGQLIGLLRWLVLNQPELDREQVVQWMQHIYLHGFSQLLNPSTSPTAHPLASGDLP